MNGKPDITANVYFYKTEEGGKKLPISSGFRCPSFISGEYFDCLLTFDKNKSILPGETVTVQISFLSPKIVRPMLQAGSHFTLWEGKTIADCTVKGVIPE